MLHFRLDGAPGKRGERSAISAILLLYLVVYRHYSTHFFHLLASLFLFALVCPARQDDDSRWCGHPSVRTNNVCFSRSSTIVVARARCCQTRFILNIFVQIIPINHRAALGCARQDECEPLLAPRTGVHYLQANPFRAGGYSHSPIASTMLQLHQRNAREGCIVAERH